MIYFSGKSFPGPQLPDIDTCTPRGGICVNDTSLCKGFTDTWALCRSSQTCCKPSPSTTHPEPPSPGKNTKFSGNTYEMLYRYIY